MTLRRCRKLELWSRPQGFLCDLSDRCGPRRSISDVGAALVFAAGASADHGPILAACRQRLEPNFVPSYLQVLEEIPKTASEKPQERLLLAQFGADAETVHREEA